ncbi:MAG: nickel-dependent hydrogenase large subunit [Fibrobacterota bacterium]
MSKVTIDPVSRIEGHLSVSLEVAGGKVTDARTHGNMYRGFENILKGRNPADAIQLTQRICGVCPVSHGIAASRAVESSFGVIPNRNGRLLRNILLASNTIQSHILHFYHLAALDYVDITSVLQYSGSDAKLQGLKSWVKNEIESKKGKSDETVASPFLPRYEGKGFYIQDKELNFTAIAHFVEALDVRIRTHRMVTLFGGRMPHVIGFVPGGLTQVPETETADAFLKELDLVEAFVNKALIPDVIAVAQAYKQEFNEGKFASFLTYGAYDETDIPGEKYFLPQGVVQGGAFSPLNPAKITEHVRYGRYTSGSRLHPSRGETQADPNKADAYSWLKAPRYDDKPLEVGPLARVMAAYLGGHEAVKSEVDGLLRLFNATPDALMSTLGRHAARAVESRLLCKRLRGWISELEMGKAPRSTYEIPDSGEGVGFAEAARGALGHWITVKDKKIANYQCVVPTTWNAGPMDDNGVKGPMEQALIGTPIADEKNPIEAARVIRSFDPCLACAVHVVRG